MTLARALMHDPARARMHDRGPNSHDTGSALSRGRQFLMSPVRGRMHDPVLALMTRALALMAPALARMHDPGPCSCMTPPCMHDHRPRSHA